MKYSGNRSAKAARASAILVGMLGVTGLVPWKLAAQELPRAGGDVVRVGPYTLRLTDVQRAAGGNSSFNGGGGGGGGFGGGGGVVGGAVQRSFSFNSSGSSFQSNLTIGLEIQASDADALTLLAGSASSAAQLFHHVFITRGARPAGAVGAGRRDGLAHRLDQLARHRMRRHSQDRRCDHDAKIGPKTEHRPTVYCDPTKNNLRSATIPVITVFASEIPCFSTTIQDNTRQLANEMLNCKMPEKSGRFKRF